MRLQVGDMAGGGRRGEGKALGRLGKAARLDDLGEHLDGDEAVHCRRILSRYSKQCIARARLYPKLAPRSTRKGISYAGLKYFGFTLPGTAEFFHSLGLPAALAYLTFGAELVG